MFQGIFIISVRRMSVTYVTGVGYGLPLCLKSLPIVAACTLGQYRRFRSQLLAGLGVAHEKWKLLW